MKNNAHLALTHHTLAILRHLAEGADYISNVHRVLEPDLAWLQATCRRKLYQMADDGWLCVRREEVRSGAPSVYFAISEAGENLWAALEAREGDKLEAALND